MNIIKTYWLSSENTGGNSIMDPPPLNLALSLEESAHIFRI